MTTYLDKLNLRPQERRLVIFVVVVVFAALNWFFVRPYFGELGRTQQRMRDAEMNIKKFQDEIQRKPLYERQEKDLALQGAQVPTGEQGTSLTREVNNQAGVAGVQPLSLTLQPPVRDSRTNSFFEEQAVNLTFANTGEPELVHFLYTLASQKSLIRVKSMLLRPDPGRMKMGGTLTLVESFQKKPPAKGAAAATPVSKTTTPAPAPKTTASPAKTSAPPSKVTSPATKTTNALPKASLPTPLSRTNNPAKKVNPAVPSPK